MSSGIPWCTCGDQGAAAHCLVPTDKCISCGFRVVVRDRRIKEIRTNGLTENEYGIRRLIIRKEEE